MWCIFDFRALNAGPGRRMKEILLNDIHKSFPVQHGKAMRKVLNGISFRIQPGDRLGIMGPNGAGKTTLINIISGALKPDSGLVHRGMSLSWPLAFGGAFQGALTGRDNTRLIARVYGKDVKQTIEIVEGFAELGPYFDEPVKSYSAGMNSRLGFGLSMAVDFDCFLVDEVISVGDIRFNRRCEDELRRRETKAMVLVSHHADLIMNNCNRAAYLYEGQLHFHETVEATCHAYHTLMLGENV